MINVIGAQPVSASIDALGNGARGRQRRALHEARALLGEWDVRMTPVAAVGDPTSEIRAAAEQSGAGVIVVGRGSGLRRLIDGSVSAASSGARPATFSSCASFLEVEASERVERVTPLELFFDLVFVFAITQVTSLLSADPTWGGLLRGMLVLGALWWAWAAYAWLTNTLNPEEGAVRLAMFVVDGRDARRRARSARGVRRRRRHLRRRLPRRARCSHIALYALAARGDPDLLGSGPAGCAVGSTIGPAPDPRRAASSTARQASRCG